MNFGRQFVVCALALALLWTTGCAKKKPQLPRQAQGPVETESAPLPYEISETTPPPPPPPPKQEAVVEEPPKAPPPKHHKKKPTTQPPASSAQGNAGAAAGATATTPPPAAASGNTTIAAAHTPANPAAETPPDTAIAADVSSAQLSQQKQTTAQLLDATEKTLTGLNHALSHDEEEMVVQVRSYIAQSRKATTDGDFERAYNLATKAHLLADALVKK
jgi:hypothetical protein